MTTPTVPAIGDLGYSYELQVDLDMNYQTGGVPDWWQLAFITNVDPGNPKNFADAATYHDRGSARQAITGESWQLTFDHQVQRGTNGLYIPTLQELVRATEDGNRNKAAKAHVRWYDTEGADYAREGTAYVAMQRAQRGNNDIAALTFTLTGDGAAQKITNPFVQPGSANPEIHSVTPAGQGTAEQVVIRGLRFTGTTNVAIGGVPAADFVVADDSSIIATLDTDSAGSAPVEVTNAAGTSAPFPYVRAA